MTNKYRTSKIYKLVNPVDNEIYVGSTTGTLQHRLSAHISNSKIKLNRCVYKHLNQIGWGNVSIELIEDYPCEYKKEILDREEYWYKELNASLNKNHPKRSTKQYRQDNKEELKTKRNIYIANNRDKINARQRKYHQKDKVKAKRKIYMETYKDKLNKSKREWSTKNREQVRANKKIWYAKNKNRINKIRNQKRILNRENINKKQREKITCDCGSIVSRVHISRHKRSSKHKKWLEI